MFFVRRRNLTPAGWSVLRRLTLLPFGIGGAAVSARWLRYLLLGLFAVGIAVDVWLAARARNRGERTGRSLRS